MRIHPLTRDINKCFFIAAVALIGASTEAHAADCPEDARLPVSGTITKIAQDHEETAVFFDGDGGVSPCGFTSIYVQRDRVPANCIAGQHVQATGRVTWGFAAFTLVAKSITSSSPQGAREAKPAAGILPAAVVPKVGESFRDCANCPEMVVVPAGSFVMGSPKDEPERNNAPRSVRVWQDLLKDPNRDDRDEGPLHGITIKRSFAAGKYAVTRDEFEAFVTSTRRKIDGDCFLRTGDILERNSARSWRSPGFAQTGSHPAVCVSWNDAKAYTAWLSKKTGKTYRLLSEAEREYVARAGTATPFWWGSSITPDQANYNGNAVYKGGGEKGEYRKKTVPVKTFQPNPWGFYQVHGNVGEWVEDCWNDNYRGAPTDGSARKTAPADSSAIRAGVCDQRVIRGGSWGADPRDLRAAYRCSTLSAGDRDNDVGFRLARILNP